MPDRQTPHLRSATPQRPEREILRAVLDFLALQPGVIAWRMNTGMAMLPGRGGQLQPVRFGVKGLPDVLGSVAWCWRSFVPARVDRRCDHGLGCTGVHGPRPFAFEVKRRGGQRSPAQLAMAATLETAGWLVAVVTSVDEVRAVLGR